MTMLGLKPRYAPTNPMFLKSQSGKWAQGIFKDDGNVLKLETVMFALLCKFSRNHCTLKIMTFMACKLYYNQLLKYKGNQV